nr:cobyric acid synthase [Rhizobium halophytocola]
MLQGTGSDVGKTVLVAGLCRLATRRGLRVRPFKPQNMSNNAAVAADGGELGRAQWLQALACKVPASVHMNPVLLKPQSQTGSQIVVQGQVIGQASGRDYQALKPQLLASVMESFEQISAEADLVIVEGAGSPAEINLRAGDIANMGFATRANVPVVLVGDIDRGGVIASLVGTHAVLPDDDRRMISGYLINKFRGDVSLFDSGLEAIDRFTGWPCVGVVPWLKSARRLPAEDSVALKRAIIEEGEGLLVAVPVLSRIANFDDLAPLQAEPGVKVEFIHAGERIPADAALVVLPGSKSTIDDLIGLRANDWDQQIAAHVARGGHVIGLCGGYQMLGRMVRDPHGIEGSESETEGLCLLDVETELAEDKTVRLSEARMEGLAEPLTGYEIHLGATFGPATKRPMMTIDGRPEGAVSADGRVAGTYLHGLFENDAYRAELLNRLGGQASRTNYRAGVEDALDQIAIELEGYLSAAWLADLLDTKG